MTLRGLDHGFERAKVEMALACLDQVPANGFADGREAALFKGGIVFVHHRSCWVDGDHVEPHSSLVDVTGRFEAGPPERREQLPIDERAALAARRVHSC